MRVVGVWNLSLNWEVGVSAPLARCRLPCGPYLRRAMEMLLCCTRTWTCKFVSVYGVGPVAS
jgi:hypothetical protein